MSEPWRECRKCGEMLPADFFPQPGHPSQPCHSCLSDYDRQRLKAAQQAQPPAEKECTSCKLLLPAALFTLNTMTATGLQSYCRKCSRRVRREHQAVTAAVPDPPAAAPPTKYCPGCQTVQPRAAFHRDSRVWVGLKGHCKACAKRRDAARRGAE